MKTLKERIEIETAFSDNYPVEYKAIDSDFSGNIINVDDADNYIFDWVRTDYRVKPKPRELFAVFGLNGTFVQASPSSSNAGNILINVAKSGTIVKFIEDIE